MRELKRNFPYKGDSLCQPLRSSSSLSYSFLLSLLPYRPLLSLIAFYFPSHRGTWTPLHHPSSPSHPPITPTPKRPFNEAYSRERKREGEFSFCLLVPATRYTPLAPNHPARSLFRCSATSRVLLDLLLAFLRLSTYSRCSGNFGRIQPSSPALFYRAPRNRPLSSPLFRIAVAYQRLYYALNGFPSPLSARSFLDTWLPSEIFRFFCHRSRMFRANNTSTRSGWLLPLLANLLKFNYNRSFSFLLFHLKEDRNISPNFIITDIPSHSFIDDLLYDTNLFQPNLFLSRTETRNRNRSERSRDSVRE